MVGVCSDLLQNWPVCFRINAKAEKEEEEEEDEEEEEEEERERVIDVGTILSALTGHKMLQSQPWGYWWSGRRSLDGRKCG